MWTPAANRRQLSPGLGFGLGLGRVQNWMGGMAAAFDPSDLGLDLDLRTPNSALTNETRKTNGLLCLPKSDTSDADANAIIDQSQGLGVDSILLDSDFSSGTDSFLIRNNIDSLTGNNDGIGGEDDWLQVDLGTTAGAHKLKRELLTLPNELVRISFKVRFDSGNTTCDGIGIDSNTAATIDHVWQNLSLNTTHELSTYVYWSDSNADIRITFYDGTSASFTPVNDLVSIKDFKVEKIAGHHFVQDTAAYMPHWDNTNFILDVDGVDDKVTAPASFNTLISADTAGMLSFVFTDNEGTGVANQLWTFNNGGNNWIFISLLTNDRLRLYVVNGGVANQMDWQQADTTKVPRSTRLKVHIGSNGTNYVLFINGVEYVNATGTNNGDWFGALAAAITFTQFSFNNGLYGANDLEYIQYKSGAILNEEERNNLDNYYGA